MRAALEHGPRRWPLSLPVSAQLGMALYRLSRFGEAARELRAAAGPVPVGPLADLAGLARHLESAADRRPYRIDGPALTRLPLLATDRSRSSSPSTASVSCASSTRVAASSSSTSASRRGRARRA